MLPGPCPYIDVSVDDVMLACLAHSYIYDYLLLYVTPHLLFAPLTTSRLDTSLYCLLPMLVFVMLLTTRAQC
jgi:hypothetical protein